MWNKAWYIYGYLNSWFLVKYIKLIHYGFSEMFYLQIIPLWLPFEKPIILLLLLLHHHHYHVRYTCANLMPCLDLSICRPDWTKVICPNFGGLKFMPNNVNWQVWTLIYYGDLGSSPDLVGPCSLSLALKETWGTLSLFCLGRPHLFRSRHAQTICIKTAMRYMMQRAI